MHALQEDTLMLIDSKTGTVKKSKQFQYEVNEFTWDKSGKYLLLTNRQGELRFKECQHHAEMHAREHTRTRFFFFFFFFFLILFLGRLRGGVHLP